MPAIESALPIEDGDVAARTLPIDKAAAENARETATYGLG